MFKLLILCNIIAIFCTNYVESCKTVQMCNEVINEKFLEEEILPDIIDELGCLRSLEVIYSSSHSVNLGNRLTPTQASSAPERVVWESNRGEYYTLLMTDPDAPSRQDPTLREIRHWLTVNIPGSALDAGEEMAFYRGPAPPLGSGLHRYIFLLFKQDKGITSFTVGEDHRNFSTRDLIRDYHLTLVAGNYFLGQNEAD